MRTLLLSILLLASAALWADGVKRPDSYNYQRALEAYNNNNMDEALAYLNKEISEHPGNGYAYAMISVINTGQEEYGKALTAINTALKKIPSKDKEYVSTSYRLRAKIYLELEDTVQAIKDMSKGLDTYPNTDLYSDRAQLYFEQEKYDLSDKDYQKITALDEGNVMGYMGIGRNAKMRNDYTGAIKQFNYVIKLAPEYSSGYSFRAECYIAQKRYGEALDDIITALKIDYDDKAYYEMLGVADSALAQTVSKLKVQKLKDPKESAWPYYIGIVYEQADQDAKAIPFYKEALALESNSAAAKRISACYDEIGNNAKALEYCEQAITLDSVKTEMLPAKADLLYKAGKSAEALSLLDEYVAAQPDYAYAYSKRGWLKYQLGKLDDAIEDYTMAVTISPDQAYFYFGRGCAYRRRGDNDKARADFEQAIRMDSIPALSSCVYYAYCYLGNRDKAIETADSAMSKENRSNCYNWACLYAIMGDNDKALSYLRKAFELGYRDFAWMRSDYDLDGIRNTAAYKTLVAEYEERLQQEMAEDTGEDEGKYVIQTEEIPYTQENGVCKVKCAINGLPLHFVFDTGAADVSISSVEATFMKKNGYLSATDITGRQNYMTADGNISEGTTIALRDVALGGLHLKDIRASVVKNQAAPLLLGQSVLAKLGKIEIDNASKKIRITYRKKITDKK